MQNRTHVLVLALDGTLRSRAEPAAKRSIARGFIVRFSFRFELQHLEVIIEKQPASSGVRSSPVATTLDPSFLKRTVAPSIEEWGSRNEDWGAAPSPDVFLEAEKI